MMSKIHKILHLLFCRCNNDIEVEKYYKIIQIAEYYDVYIIRRTKCRVCGRIFEDCKQICYGVYIGPMLQARKRLEDAGYKDYILGR